MRSILALPKIPESVEETKEMFFGEQNLMVQVNYGCSRDPRENYANKPDLYEEAKALKIEDGIDSWKGIMETDFVSSKMFESLFEDKKNITRDEMVAFVRTKQRII